MSVPDKDAQPHDGAPLPALLHALAARVATSALDDLWIFPPRRVGTVETAVVVASAFDEGAANPTAQRRVITARYTARHGGRGQPAIECEIIEHGTAPADRIGRLIEGVLRRLDDELAAQPPRAIRIGGDPSRWDMLLNRPSPEGVPE